MKEDATGPVKALLRLPDGQRIDITDIFALVQSGQYDAARDKLAALLAPAKT